MFLRDPCPRYSGDKILCWKLREMSQLTTPLTGAVHHATDSHLVRGPWSGTLRSSRRDVNIDCSGQWRSLLPPYCLSQHLRDSLEKI